MSLQIRLETKTVPDSKNQVSGTIIECENCYDMIYLNNYPGDVEPCERCLKLLTKTKLGFKCTLCPVKTASSNEMLSHVRSKHSKDNEIIVNKTDNSARKCLYCEKILDSCSPKYFLQHVNSCLKFSEIAKKTSNTCQFCSRKFQRSHFLFAHIRNKHSSEPEFETNQREEIEIQEDWENSSKRSDSKIKKSDIEYYDF